MLTPIDADVNTSKPSMWNGCFNFSSRPLDHCLDVVVAIDRIDQQDEFVAADAREHVGLADERGDALRDLHQQRIADRRDCSSR